MLTLNRDVIFTLSNIAILISIIVLIARIRVIRAEKSDEYAIDRAAFADATFAPDRPRRVFEIVLVLILASCIALSAITKITGDALIPAIEESDELSPLLALVERVNIEERMLSSGKITREDFSDTNAFLPHSGFAVSEPYMIIESHPRTGALKVIKCTADSPIITAETLKTLKTVVYVDPEIGDSARYNSSGNSYLGYETIHSYEMELYFFDVGSGTVTGYEVIPARNLPDELSSDTTYVRVPAKDIIKWVERYVAPTVKS